MMSRHGFDLARKRELDLGIVELLGRGTTAFAGGHLFHLDDLTKKNVGEEKVSGNHQKSPQIVRQRNALTHSAAYVRPTWMEVALALCLAPMSR